jgi:long-chain acyl-CoA synthetase
MRPWGTQIVRRTAGKAPFLQYTPRHHRLPELVEEAARWADRPYVVQGGRRLSFRDFRRAVHSVADRLKSTGANQADVLLLLAANSPDWVVTFWAAQQLGATVAVGNGWWSQEETRHALRRTAPALVIADERQAGKLDDAARIVAVSEIRKLVDAPTDSSVIAPDGDEDDPAVVVFTAGTTGLPKGVVLSHRAVIANIHNLLHVSDRLPHTLGDDYPRHVSLMSGPLFHIGGIQLMTLGLVTGGTLAFLEGRFDPGQVLDVIERERVNVWGAVATMASRLLDHPSLAERELSSMRSISLGGSPVSPELVARLRRAFPNAQRGVSTIYGLTETGGTVTTASGTLMMEHPGTSGRPLPVVELRIHRPDHAGTGEILVRTPGQMDGYLGEQNDDVIDDEGWVHTGDLGYLADGLLYITGRSKDVIIRGGENIAALRVEAVLGEHPAVAAVAVVGLPDRDLGERVAAAIVPRRGALVTTDELRTLAAARLAHFELPTDWWIRDEALPTNDAGKIDKAALRGAWPAAEPSIRDTRPAR